MAYWDTSALIKLYASELDSEYFLELAAEADEAIVSSAVATTEVLCVLHRKEHARVLRRGGAMRLLRQFRADVQSSRILLIPYERDVETESEKLAALAFRGPRPILIRSLDLIHVCSALACRAGRMVATDARLRSVARLAQLDVMP